ncbi:hypothetical protein [Actinoplanes sp. NPDC051494]|uniref:hypothetical protein n=1 Tax=Actinoplanes sp. NPDC051494 TaxID=3363907 RepID=UPI0037A90611
MDVTRRTPGLRFEVASGRRMLVRQSERVILLARVHPHNYDVELVRTGGYRSPLPPLRADDARRVTVAGWEQRFAGWLRESDIGPLYAGRWCLSEGRLGHDLVREWPATTLDWFGAGWHGTVPLRPLSGPADAREGSLPPLLLWSVTGLDGYLLLDGHDRLVAAQAEGMRPAVLVLATEYVLEPDEARRATAYQQTALDRAAEQVTLGVPGAEAAHRSLRLHLAGLPPLAARTRAWPLPGGAAEWDRLAAAAPPFPAEQR